MKTKIVFAIAIIAIITSCSSLEEGVDFISHPKSDLRRIRSFDEALQVAQSAVSLLDNSVKTRSVLPRKIDFNDSRIYRIESKTRSSSGGNDTLMYVFNFEENQGFAIISASWNTDAIIALAENGHYEPNVKTGIEGFDYYISLAEKYVESESLRLLTHHYDTTYVFLFPVGSVGPYVTVRWGQHTPEGNFCPNNVAGCTNTAMAQLMSYYEYPSSISLTYEGADTTIANLNWTIMKNYPNSLPSQAGNSIAYLCRQLGEMNHSSYYFSPPSTSTFTMIYGESTLQSLGYQTGVWTNYSNLNAKNEIDNNHILLMRGTDLDEGGHAWISDGYVMANCIISDTMGINGEWTVIDRYTTTLFHQNWGWYGINNGYFNQNVFNTSNGILYDTNNNYANYNFSENVKALPVWCGN